MKTYRYVEDVILLGDYTHGISETAIRALWVGCGAMHSRVCDPRPREAFHGALAAIGYTVRLSRSTTRHSGPDSMTTHDVRLMHYQDFSQFGAPVGWQQVNRGPIGSTCSRSSDLWDGSVGQARETQTLAGIGGGAD